MTGLIKKSYRHVLLVLILILVSGLAVCIAQDKITELNEVEILSSKIHKFGIGSTLTTIDSSVLTNNGQTSLATLLSYQSSVYIKQYGSGMLSSVSFRGTGAGHTVIQWNGLQVGYPFLGQADLSLMPIDFIGQVTLQHGSASARYGTGAIGGIIDLQSGVPKSGTNFNLNQSVGSFGVRNTSLQLSRSGTKGFVRVGAIYKQSQNDFSVRSCNGNNLGNQNNADYAISGGQLESNYVLNQANSVHVVIQSVFADRNLQPSIGSNASNNQKDANLWSSINYSHLTNSGDIAVQYGFLYDQIDYDGSVTESTQHITKASYENDFTNNLSAKFGVNSTWVEVETPFYEGSEAEENRVDLFTSVSYNLTNRLNTSINLRQAYLSGFKIPFTPSVGLEFKAVQLTHIKLAFIGQLAKGYKMPTLNDRFWVPGGNLNLKPEESVNAEVGFRCMKEGLSTIWLKGTTYQLWVNDWILWLPNGAVWSPKNKRKVKGFGIELESGFAQTIGKGQLKGSLNYAYTKSTNLEALDRYDRSVGKQLPYVPFHNGNITAQATYLNWHFVLNTTATGKRFVTSDNETEVSGYMLLNARMAYDFHLKLWQMQAYFEGNNLTNTNYQSIINKAMPEINFLVGIKINFKK